VDYKLKRPELNHLPHVKNDGIKVEAAQWNGVGSPLPHWCSYQADPSSLPGRMLIISPEGEAVAKIGDMIVLCENGLLAVDPCDFFKIYREA